jgi:hypothetical protein
MAPVFLQIGSFTVAWSGVLITLNIDLFGGMILWLIIWSLVGSSIHGGLIGGRTDNLMNGTDTVGRRET